MDFLPQSLQSLIHEFSELPGIGTKTAQRLAFYLLRSQHSLHQKLGTTLLRLKENILLCENCAILTDQSFCTICSDFSRDTSTICVVEEALDALAIEKTHDYKGTYHVLHGAISPIDGIGPEDITIAQLEKRLKRNDPIIKEIILATNPTMEGEATAMYIHNLLKPYDIKISRIACGIPMGGDLEYADQMTLKNALEGRHIY
ncbi:recombination protein RecR [Candidatus Peregrinibacteria bacterium]|nr:recombination protein RecR [Candidatus Peregrinibacteria bacterium]